jgi:hypothetical protein
MPRAQKAPLAQCPGAFRYRVHRLPSNRSLFHLHPKLLDLFSQPIQCLLQISPTLDQQSSFEKLALCLKFAQPPF